MIAQECPCPGRVGRSFLLVLFSAALVLASTACSNPEKAKLEHIQRGESYLKEKKFQEASIEFRNAAQIDDRLASAHWGLAQAYEGLGQFQQAYQELLRTIGLDANHLEARLRAGNYLLLSFQSSKKDEALTEADRLADEVLSRDPNYIEGHILKAGILRARGKNDEALKRLEQALQIDPNRIETHLGLARFHQVNGDAAQAEATYKRAISINNASALAHGEYGKFLVQQNRLAEAEAELQRAVEIDPRDRTARLTLGSFYFLNKRFDKAEEAYKALAELDRDDPEGRAVLADYYGAANRPDEAIRLYQEIAAASPDYTRAFYRLAELMIQKGDVNGAKGQVEEVLKKSAGDMQALLLRARIRMLNDLELKEAIEDLKQVLKQDPQNRIGLYYIAEAHMRTGQFDQARVFVGDLAKNHPDYLPGKLMQAQISLLAGGADNLTAAKQDVNELLAQLAKTAPDAENSSQLLAELQVKALTLRGAANVQQKNLAAARADFTAARDAAPNSPEVYSNLAGVALAESKRDEATQFYERALSIDGANFNALRGLIDLYILNREYDQAHARIDQALAARPNSAGFHYLKAHVYGFQRDGQNAETQLRRALAIDPNFLLASRTLGSLYVNTDKPEQAINEYNELIKKRPDDAVSHLMIGMVEDTRKNYAAANESYKRALAINGNLDFAANNLAWNYAEHASGNLDEAVRLAQGVVQRNPNVPGYVDTLGWVYYKKGLHAAAVQQLQKAVDMVKSAGGDSAVYHYHLGLAQKEAGRRAEARQQLQQALNVENGLSPQQTEEARKALATL